MREVRPFARHDRDGLVALVNHHIAAVLPGGSIPVASLLSYMEHDSREVIIEPWVVDRHSLVAIERDRVVAAAHLKRFGSNDPVGESYRNNGEITWLVCERGHLDAGAELLAAATHKLAEWNVREWWADGTLPCLGIYGVPDAWPHVQQLYIDAGFDDDGGQIELVLAGDLSTVDAPGDCPMPAVDLRRVVGPLGTSFEAWRDDERLGVFEVEDFYGIANASLARWADVANHWVLPEHRGQGIGTWLVQHGCAWLRLAGKEAWLAYATERWGDGAGVLEGSGEEWEAYYGRYGLRRITRTRRGWHRTPA